LAGWLNKVEVCSLTARYDWREKPTSEHLVLGIVEVNLAGLMGGYRCGFHRSFGVGPCRIVSEDRRRGLTSSRQPLINAPSSHLEP
jgi:hypothetical protein